eukprot:gnl/Dysnectes_brevis/2865_a3501_1016.p1 GENE.gnl/Dysnectes_brevis/2865_a3501_1016~~gnl/Dysnectes_brevis/2865_a3501_1016.p1  ORF type:complete len:228 (+),score=18.85 gnl/Dysnectes_brevis/2865_a3501_1016:89-685(+)
MPPVPKQRRSRYKRRKKKPVSCETQTDTSYSIPCFYDIFPIQLHSGSTTTTKFPCTTVLKIIPVYYAHSSSTTSHLPVHVTDSTKSFTTSVPSPSGIPLLIPDPQEHDWLLLKPLRLLLTSEAFSPDDEAWCVFKPHMCLSRPLAFPVVLADRVVGHLTLRCAVDRWERAIGGPVAGGKVDVAIQTLLCWPLQRELIS